MIALDSSVLVDLISGRSDDAEAAAATLRQALQAGPVALCEVALAEVCSSLQRGGNRSRTVADFLIGAHAMMQCDALVTRDAGFYRDYFKGLKVIVPQA